jgi:hypothetical protein
MPGEIRVVKAIDVYTGDTSDDMKREALKRISFKTINETSGPPLIYSSK